MTTEFKLKSHPADFECLNSAFRTITLQMGLTMERTARSPIYYSAHDFSTAITDKEANLVTLAEYIPIHICAAPFAIKATLKYFGDDIHAGDLILVNDPYSYDAGNHLADWTVLVPVFYQGQPRCWSINRAHQIDTGGPVVGGYNPGATDIFAEGLRIPPIKLFEGGKPRNDIFDFILANVRFPETQRGDLWSMIGSARIGERRLMELLDIWGVETIERFFVDLYNYTEFLMRNEISRIPDGTYYGESSADGPRQIGHPITVRCNTTVKGDSLIVDFSQSDPQIDRFLNSSIANTYSGTFVALMTSIGRTIKYRSEGCMRPVEIRTKPKTITHPAFPAPVGCCTLVVGKQVIQAVWDSLAKVIPERTPAGWGGFAGITISGFDPRRNEGYATPDFLSNAAGAGAIGDTDGWDGNHAEPASGGMRFPEVEVFDMAYPGLWKRWEFITDSAGAGKARGGAGVGESFILNQADQMNLAQMGCNFTTMPSPAVLGGKRPPFYSEQVITRANGVEENISGEEFNTLGRNDELTTLCQGGCGVGDPLDRDIEKVRQDVIDEFVSLEAAQNLYGVVIDPITFKVDEAATKKLRLGKRS